MELKERLQFCKKCELRKFNSQVGIVCSLTKEKPAFEGTCESFVIDEKVIKKEFSRAEAKEIGNSFPVGAISGVAITLIIIILKLFLRS